MAFNPFKSKPPVDKPNRNAFDLSFANNMTMEFGKLYPVFCKECLPGDTFRINPTFSFRFMPMYFPVQSRMRADLKFFYVRNRNLWKNWKKFIGQTDRISGQQVVPPTLSINESAAYRLKTGSLLDYLGVPTTAPQLVRSSDTYTLFSAPETTQTQDGQMQRTGYMTGIDGVNCVDMRIDKIESNRYTFDDFNASVGTMPDIFDENDYQIATKLLRLKSRPTRDLTITMPYVDASLDGDSLFETQFLGGGYLLFFKKSTVRSSAVGSRGLSVGGFINPNVQTGNLEPTYRFLFGCPISTTLRDGSIVVSQSNYVGVTQYDSNISIDGFFEDINPEEEEIYFSIALNYDESKLQFEQDKVVINRGLSNVVIFPHSVEFGGVLSIENKDLDPSLNPFITHQGESGPQIGLSALPCRAYEACYNSFYRNIEVNPFRINQSDEYSLPTSSDPPEYDKFIPSESDGPDSYPYDFHFANWEHDFLTDAMPSPQMGDTVPLVGGRPSVPYTQVNLNSADGNVQASVYVDGNTKELLSLTPNSSSEELSEALSEAINFGISINDFRNVNALQKWLEKNVRRGYRYKDQILSHFGVGLTYEECDMPEYIGGVSQDVDVRAISQSVETDTGALGALAGQGGVYGSSKSEIDKYTDEHGFIIGILCIVPIPTYSQLLPKHFMKMSPLDYFTPEFGHIGYQPIPKKEVAPLNIALGGLNQYEETFGYQRAHYDYLSSVDEVHGEFRDTLDTYLVDRVFEGVPELSQEFLQVDPTQINDIFNYTQSDDKILGQLWFDCTVVRPIPKYGVPRLE